MWNHPLYPCSQVKVKSFTPSSLDNQHSTSQQDFQIPDTGSLTGNISSISNRMKWWHAHPPHPLPQKPADLSLGSLRQRTWPECQVPESPLMKVTAFSPALHFPSPLPAPSKWSASFFSRVKGPKYQTVLCHRPVAMTEAIKWQALKTAPSVPSYKASRSLHSTASISLSFLASELQYPWRDPLHYISWGLNASL